MSAVMLYQEAIEGMTSSVESYKGIEFTIVEGKFGRENISLFYPKVRLGVSSCQLWGEYRHIAAVLAVYKRIDTWLAEMESRG
jgi:hypothetical protein